MKTFLLLLFLTTSLFSQTYMNILFSDASSKYSDIDEIVEIIFSTAGTEMTTTLSGGASSTDALSDITEITFDATPNGNPLPVELTSFYANVKRNDVTLNWTTATEVNNYGFQVERKINKRKSNWGNIGFVEGHGNSNAPQNYSFTDTPTGSNKFEYRLKQIDIDGKFEYSQIITVELGVPIKYALKQNHPNPFNPNTVITYTIPKAGKVTLKVYTILGEELTTLVNEYQESGEYKAHFTTNGNIASGIYITRMESGNYSKIIKMILLR